MVFMSDGIPFGEFLAFGNLLQSPPDDLNGLSVVGVLRLGSEPNFLSLGLVEPHIGIVRFVVGAGQETNEEGLRVISATNAEGVVRSLAVVNSEDCPTRFEELGVLNVVHCGDSMG
jgi:hypothetical protein